MKNLVGDVIPSDKEIAARVADVNTIQSRVEKYTCMLSQAERAQCPKPRGGWEVEGAPLVVSLSKKHGIVIPKVPLDGILPDVTLAQRLVPLRDAIATLLQRIDDTILEAKGESFTAGTAYYGALCLSAARDAEMEHEVAPLIGFFAIGPRAPKDDPSKK